MNASESDGLIDRLNSITIFLNKYILSMLYVLTNLGNILCALVFAKKSWKKNVCVFYFKIYLLYTTFYNNSTNVASICVHGYKTQLQNSNVFICKIYFYFAFVFARLCPTVLMLASIDRLLISSRDVHTRLYSSKRLAYFSISFSTAFWMLSDIDLLFKVNIQEIYSSTYICYFDFTGNYSIIVNYISIGTNIVFFSSVLSLSMFAFKNVRHLPQQQRNDEERFSITSLLICSKRCFYFLCSRNHFVLCLFNSNPKPNPNSNASSNQYFLL